MRSNWTLRCGAAHFAGQFLRRHGYQLAQPAFGDGLLQFGANGRRPHVPSAGSGQRAPAAVEVLPYSFAYNSEGRRTFQGRPPRPDAAQQGHHVTRSHRYCCAATGPAGASAQGLVGVGEPGPTTVCGRPA